MLDELAPERIAKLKAHLEDALLHSGRVEEDALYETGLALIARYKKLEAVADTAVAYHLARSRTHMTDEAHFAALRALMEVER